MRTLLPLLLAVLLAAPVTAVQIHVDPVAGSDTTGDGSALRPFRSLTRGFAQAKAGDVLVPGAGTYDHRCGEIFPLLVPAGVSLVGPGEPEAVTIVSVNPYLASMRVLVGAGSQTRLSGFILAGGWTGLEVLVQGPGTAGSEVDLNRVRVEGAGQGLDLYDTTTTGVRPVVLRLDRCHVHGCTSGGVRVRPTQGTVTLAAVNTVIQNNGDDGVLAWPGGQARVDLDLLHCTVARNGRYGVLGMGTVGLDGANLLVWGNRRATFHGVPVDKVHSSLLGGGTAVGLRGNRSGAPAFLDGVDWHLGPGSAALGVGAGSRVGKADVDLDGQPRSSLGPVDAGADQQTLNTLVQDPRGMRIYRDYSFRIWSKPGASAVLFISYELLLPGIVVPPLSGRLQLNYLQALELVGTGRLDSRGILDFKGPGFTVNALVGTSVAFQGVVIYPGTASFQGEWTNPIRTWFIAP